MLPSGKLNYDSLLQKLVNVLLNSPSTYTIQMFSRILVNETESSLKFMLCPNCNEMTHLNGLINPLANNKQFL